MKKRSFTLLMLALLCAAGCSKTQNADPATGDKTTTGTGGTSNTCNAKIADVESLSVFPANNSWNQDVSAAPIDPYSNQIIAAISASHLKADFGSGLYDGVSIGIPFNVVCGNQPKIKVTFRANSYDGNYGSESDAGPYPIPDNAHIEAEGKGGDSHVIVVDRDNDMLYELYNASFANGKQLTPKTINNALI